MTQQLSPKDISAFQTIVWDYYHAHARQLPWRMPPYDPYAILVSECMLQQTQVQRVIPKYAAFLSQFPTLELLAAAPLKDVLTLWSGLGYNRRAKYLHEAAKRLIHVPQPWSHGSLVACSGIGPNTAAAIRSYAYNAPDVFIETNIRSVFIYHFFDRVTSVTDKDIIELVRVTLPTDQAREWYWALMDYGTHIKASVGNVSKRSVGYTKQSAFHGSRRQVRGQVLRALALEAKSLQELTALIPDERLAEVCLELAEEGLISQTGAGYALG